MEKKYLTILEEYNAKSFNTTTLATHEFFNKQKSKLEAEALGEKVTKEYFENEIYNPFIKRSELLISKQDFLKP